MSRKGSGRIEALEEVVRKLKNTIKRRDKTIRQLRSEIKTIEQAWRTTEVYLKEITNGKPLSEVLETVEAGKPLSKLNDSCPKCNSNEMKKIIFTGFYIVSCSCGYRNKVDEERKIRKGKRA